MRIVRLSERSYFSPPGSKAQVSILSGKNPEHGSFEKHTVAIVKLPPDGRLDRHFHKHREESYLVLSGSGMAIVDDKEIKIGPGDLVTVSPGEKHLFQADRSQHLEYAVVTAPAWTLEDVHT